MIDPGAAGWRTWTVRDAPAPQPRFERHGHTLSMALPDDAAAFGKWISPPVRVTPGATYRARVWLRVEGVPHPEMSATPMLTWRGKTRAPWGAPWHADDVDRGRPPALGLPRLAERRYLRPALPGDGAVPPDARPGWLLWELTMRAPDVALGAELELWLRFAPGGRAWWGGAELVEVPARPQRLVTLGTMRAGPPPGSTLESNRALLVCLAEQVADMGADLVVLPENALFQGTGLGYRDIAEPVPGPTTDALRQVAAARRVWLVVPVIERRGYALYNTAVLIDRQGQIVAQFDKLHPTTSELELGIVPGAGPVVASTELGRIGLLICYDLQFPESSRLTALHGAEILCGPTSGDRWDERRVSGNRMHALANGLFVITSLNGNESVIVDPLGRILAAAEAPNSVATARVDLDYKETLEGRLIGPGGGQHPSLYFAESRPDLYTDPNMWRYPWGA